jgi:hypothetical protein
MKEPMIKNSFSLKLLIVVLLFAILNGCQKADHLGQKEQLAQRADHLPQKKTPESADVVHQWYRFIASLQRPMNPQPVALLQLRNFSFIGVGLYEAVQPGIHGAQSLSTRLYQMPGMPKAQMSEDYLWSASANAALASMFKQFLTGLTVANKASIDSLEKANIDRFKLSTPENVLTRSQNFGRSIANAIYNWSTTDNFNLSSVGWVLPVFPAPGFPLRLLLPHLLVLF